ncbi:MAG: nitroreductase family protein [Saprospiraceae bacterium]|nr:nitroreductase family protein [Saprospiraceae bacterium]
MLERSQAFYELLDQRRSIRFFSDKDVPVEVLENCIKAASTAPSGAHKQPWTFCLISNSEVKSAIRKAAEEEEYTNYNGRMSERWLEDLKKFGTDWEKPFLEIAPYLIIVFKKSYDLTEAGEKTNNYYVNESVGIATGMLLAALHNAGLATLTHTPSPMNFLAEVLERPKNEKAFLLIPVGYPTEDCTVPNIERKGLDDILVRY